MNIVRTALATTLAATLFSSTVLAVTIDNFTIDLIDDGNGPIAETPRGAAPQTDFANAIANDGSILGGERDVVVEKTAGSNSSRVSLAAGPDALNSLEHSQGARAQGFSLIVWDGLDASRDLQFGLNFDLAAAGDFQIGNLVSDREGSISLFVFTSADSFSVFTFPTGVLGGEEPDGTSFGISTADFVVDSLAPTLANGRLVDATGSIFPNVAAQSGADFTDIRAIALLIDGSDVAALDASLNFLSVESIPLPASFLFLMTGLIGLKLRIKAQS